MQIELTKQQADGLINLIDLAVKAGGIQAAKFAVSITDLIVAAANAEGDAETETPENG